MKNFNDFLRDIGAGNYDEFLADLYGRECLDFQRSRLIKALNEFENQFGSDRNIRIFSAPGRTEICGNHTDHQGGNVLAAGIGMDTIAIVSANNDGVIRVQSEGFPLDEIAVSLSIKNDPREYSPLGDFVITDLDPYPEEEYKSISLIRGIAARFYLMGRLLKGFDCYTTSTILNGVGLSSSAAFEVLIGNIMNEIYMRGSVLQKDIAEIGQFAENYYYKKPGGLMAQLSSALGGIQWMDFYDSDTPFVTKVNFDFQDSEYIPCIIVVGKPKNVSTYEYNAILHEMKAVANFFGKNVLSRVEENEFLTYIKDVRRRCGDRAVLRAWHFFEEDKRAVKCAKLLQKNNFPEFLNEINRSGRSSFMYLQNVYSSGNVNEQPLAVALANCERLLNGRGAFRIHGNGFGGTVQAFVPMDMIDYFKLETEKLFGEGSCRILKIRRKGCVELGGNYV